MKRIRKVSSGGYMPMGEGVDLSRKVNRLPFLSSGASVDSRFAPSFREMGLGASVDSRYSPHFMGDAEPTTAPVIVVAQDPQWQRALTITSSILGLYVFYHFIIKPNLR